MISQPEMPFQQSDISTSRSFESMINQRINTNLVPHTTRFLDEITFELELRNNIILSARALNQSNAAFEVFESSRCNPRFWHLMNTGGFLLRRDVKPSDAIQDIYMNSSLYAFECATAMVIIFYHAVLNLIGEYFFNQLFSNLYLYSWNFDPDLGLQTIYTDDFLPGDVVYFKNPDFNPYTPEWKGLNAVVLDDGTFFAHGIGIGTAEQFIHILNQLRKPWATRSAYMTDLVVKPSFSYLEKLSPSQRDYSNQKYQHILAHHNESSISFDRYMLILKMVYNNF